MNENQALNFDQIEATSANMRESDNFVLAREFNYADSAFELGQWLLGLKSFLNTKNHAFIDGNHSRSNSRDWSNELRLSHSSILYASSVITQLIYASQKNENSDHLFDSLDSGVSVDSGAMFFSGELNQIGFSFRNLALISEALLRSGKISFHEWVAWGNIVSNEIDGLEIAAKLMANAERIGEDSIPAKLREIFAARKLKSSFLAEMGHVLPRFSKVLKYLTLVEKMLNEDRPLKPALLLFAVIYEQTQDTIRFMNTRLKHFEDQESKMFEALDGAIFVTTMEIRKVFQGELADAASIRQAPVLCARIDAAYGILRDCFQQNFVGFAQLLDPTVDPKDIFENFKSKFDQSITLRKELWGILEAVRKAEKDPSDPPMEALNQELIHFTDSGMKFLMYKDIETVERFTEEVVRARNTSDLVPLLHRFGAYLETLFGQVCMRAILADHPFEP